MAVLVRFVDACSSKSSWSPRRPCLADRGRIGLGPAAHVEHARRLHCNSSPVPCAKGTVQMVFPGALKPRGGLTGFYVPLRPKPQSSSYGQTSSADLTSPRLLRQNGRQRLDRRMPNRQTMRCEVDSWQRARNALRRTIEWTLTRHDADQELKYHYVPILTC